jgi:hypothetical protein
MGAVDALDRRYLTGCSLLLVPLLVHAGYFDGRRVVGPGLTEIRPSSPASTSLGKRPRNQEDLTLRYPAAEEFEIIRLVELRHVVLASLHHLARA